MSNNSTLKATLSQPTQHCLVQVLLSYCHSSLIVSHGTGAAIDLESSLVLDYEVLSNFCARCRKCPPFNSPDFAAWMAKRKPKSQANYVGSSQSMEKAAAVSIFSRAIEKRCLLCGTMLCDGDSNSFERVNQEVKSYDIDVIKEDCINHISKRMYNGLTN